MTSTTISQTTSHRIQVQASSRFSQLLQGLSALHRRMSARRDLQSLNADQLRDVGIDPSLVSAEPAYQTDPRTMIRLTSMW